MIFYFGSHRATMEDVTKRRLKPREYRNVQRVQDILGYRGNHEVVKVYGALTDEQWEAWHEANRRFVAH